jgi:hypothetical protein
VVVGALAVAGAGFLPWGASGREERSSYALVGVVDRLDVLDGPAAVLARAWYLAPAAAAVVWLAAAAQRRALALAVAAVLAAAGVALALAVRASPLTARPGTCATIAGAAVVGAGLVLAAVERRRNRPT